MTVPAYLAAFRRAVRELEGNEKNEFNEKSPTLISYNSFNSYPPASENSENIVATATASNEINEIRLSIASESPESGAYEINEFNEKRVEPFPYAAALDALERRCPAYVEPDRWQQCVEDAQRFLATWGDKAQALGWTGDELFGLDTPPANPHPSYHRLSRYDCTGLIWGLLGRRVVALTDSTAAVAGHTGNVTTYRKLNKPAYGPLGDSLDDFTT